MNSSLSPKTPCKAAFIAGAAMALAASSLSAQFAFSPGNLVYSEDFSGLDVTTSPSSSKPWVDDVTVPHWRARVSDAPATSYNVTHGTSGASGLQVWHAQDGTNRRALGSLTDINNRNALLAFGMLNSTGSVIDEIQIDFTQVQWYGGTVAAIDKVAFSYQVNYNSHTGGAWTTFSALDMDGFSNGGGGLSEAIFTEKSATLGGLAWQPGEQLWIRWLDLRASGGNAGAGLDSISITAIPEPSTYALAIGALALAGAFIRRRKLFRCR